MAANGTLRVPHFIGAVREAITLNHNAEAIHAEAQKQMREAEKHAAAFRDGRCFCLFNITMRSWSSTDVRRGEPLPPDAVNR